jgi:2-polyprenyl-6-methoxyphenol hydroxylase-like FAD-dependent oxidoreductase
MGFSYSPRMDTTCCIIGGGPAGMMLGFLLARSGVRLLEKFLALPHSQVTGLSAIIGGETFQMSDLSHVPTHAKFIALMPQWDFLNFLAQEATAFPSFNLKMGWEATGLIESEGTVTGVRVRTPDGPVEIAADLVVGCDGRHATSRDAGHLEVVEQGVPIDVRWMRIGRQPDDPENALGYINFGRVLILINRNDYFQCGYLIAKGTFPEIQQQGLAKFQTSIERLAPFLKGRTGELDSWDKVKLLTVQINHLRQWARPGLLCIGDAAHAMSPVGGIGINIALQDAVATANRLAEPLRSGSVTPHDLRAVQYYRVRAVLRTQSLQAFAHRILSKVLANPGPVKPPLALRVATKIPGFQQLAGRFVGVGLQPEHIQTATRT